MARYLVKEATKLMPLQAGDYPQPLVFIVPDVLDMTGHGVSFIMEDHDNNEIINKNSTGQYVIIDGQNITINFTEADTKHRQGVFDWVLKVTMPDEVITVGYGTIQINKIVA